MLRSWLILCACLPLAHGAPDPLADAERASRAGMPAQAAVAFRRHLREQPGDPEAVVGLVTAAARLGRCDEAVELVASLEVASSRARTAEADCHLRSGRLAEAAAAYDDALRLDPEHPGALVGRALAASASGDGATVAALLPEIRLQRRGGLLEGLVRAQWAYDGGSDTLDLRLVELDVLLAGRGGARRAILDGRRWLDLDDPVTAARTLGDAARRYAHDPHVALWYAESLRRLGEHEGAREALDRPIARRLADDVHARAVRARLLVDDGALERARALLAADAESLDPDVIASVWYVARAAGDVEAVERQAHRWARRVDGARGSLDALVPLHLREGT